MKHGLLFVLVSVAVIQVVSGCFQDCGCGGLDKSDPYIFLGEYLDMTCTLYNDTVERGDNSSKLVFHSIVDNEYAPVPENETTEINSTSLVLHKKMTSFSDSGPYQCCLTDPISTTKEKVGRTYVELEYPPQKVENFQCIFYDWDERLTCTWDLGVQYQNLHNINVSLIIYNGAYGSCPNLQLTNCTWTKGDPVTFDKSTLHFIVNVKNIRRNVEISTAWITIKQQENVLPSKVDHLDATAVNSTCIDLKWSHPREHRSKAFIITYTSKWKKDQESVTTEGLFKKICNLKPYTMYNFTIVTVPGLSQGYMSDPEYNGTMTDFDVPSRPPEISGGGYMVTKDCQNGRKTATLYWKSVPEEFQNGPMKGYQISVNNSYCHEFKESSQCVFDVEPNVLEKSFEIPCDQQTTFFIRSVGAAGMSDYDSAISITVDHDILRPKQVIVEAQMNNADTSVSLSWDWNLVLDSPVKSCTVYYCQYDTKCTNEIAWKYVYNSTHTIIEDVKFDRKYRFGVSCDGSGFKWQTCYYFKNMAPSPPSTVEVSTFPDDAITVDWSEPECEKSPYISYYRVTWCEVDRTTKTCRDPATKKMKIIPSTEPSSYVIQDVDVGTLYGVAVQFQARDGNWSVESDVKPVQPTNSDWQIGQIVGASVGGTFVLAFFIAGILFCYRKCKTQIQVYSKPYDIPTIAIQASLMREPNSSSTSSSGSSTSSASDQLLVEKRPRLNGQGKEYISQISKDSGRGSITSDTLHSPLVDGKMNGLFPVKEESSLNSSDSKSKLFLERETEQPLDSNYARVTMLDQQEFTNMIALNQRTGSDAFSLASRTSTYKSSSEEKMLVKLNEKDDEDGYKDLDGRSKSLDTIRSRRSLPDDYCVDSYVRQDLVDKKEYSASQQPLVSPPTQRETDSSEDIKDSKMDLETLSKLSNADSSATNVGYISEQFVRDNITPKQTEDTNSSPYITETKMMEFPVSVNKGYESDESMESPDVTELYEVDINLSGSSLANFSNYDQKKDLNNFLSYSQGVDSPISDSINNTCSRQEEGKVHGNVDEKVLPNRNIQHKEKKMDSYIEDLLNQNFEKDEEEVDSYVDEKLLLNQLVDNSVEKVDSYFDEKRLLNQLVDNSVEKVDRYVDEKMLLNQLVDNSVEKVDSYVDGNLNTNNVNCINNNDCLGEEYDTRTSETNLHTNEDSSSGSAINESNPSFGYVSHELLQQ